MSNWRLWGWGGLVPYLFTEWLKWTHNRVLNTPMKNIRSIQWKRKLSYTSGPCSAQEEVSGTVMRKLHVSLSHRHLHTTHTVQHSFPSGIYHEDLLLATSRVYLLTDLANWLFVDRVAAVGYLLTEMELQFIGVRLRVWLVVFIRKNPLAEQTRVLNQVFR